MVSELTLTTPLFRLQQVQAQRTEAPVLFFAILLAPLVDSPNDSAGCGNSPIAGMSPSFWTFISRRYIYTLLFVRVPCLHEVFLLSLWIIFDFDAFWNFPVSAAPLIALRSYTLTSANFGGLSLKLQGLYVMWCQSLVPPSLRSVVYFFSRLSNFRLNHHSRSPTFSQDVRSPCPLFPHSPNWTKGYNMSSYMNTSAYISSSAFRAAYKAQE